MRYWLMPERKFRLAAFGAFLSLAGCGDVSGPANDAAASKETIERPVVIPGERSTPAPPLTHELVRVRMETDMGPIVIELNGRRAPVTTSNFLRYVDAGRYDDIFFYRAARTRGHAHRGFIQGGINRNYRRMFPPVAHEATSETGLSHVEGAISMARSAPGAAMGEFFITSVAIPQMDAEGEDPGYATFGRVVEGMDVVREILALPTIPNAGRGAMRDQMIREPVRIISVRREE